MRSEGGFLADAAILDIYTIAADMGVVDFVVPGTRIDDIKRIKYALDGKGVNAAFYSPGFVAQGGSLRNTSSVVGGNDWHAIVGRGIYNAADMRSAALEYAGEVGRTAECGGE